MEKYEYEYCTREVDYINNHITWSLGEIKYISNEPTQYPPLSFLKELGKQGWMLIIKADENIFLFMKKI